ncbi:hypothetical protein VTJ83DRAFT_2081 [Remersonia thermophila]|uniref:Centromere protein H C-terminal domain-containing protein n=1 Tax=Remersonia thermophila TaxID=72144 RepID=A0ABR4DK26_9PEZI
MASNTPAKPSAVFTGAELAVLGLFDQLQQLQLELALLRSRSRALPSATYGASQHNEQNSEEQRLQLLEAKATLALRDSIIENTISLQPTLNAVHHATGASPAERDLLPTIEQRDSTAIQAARICNDLQTSRSQLADLEKDNLALCQQNIELADEILGLVTKAHPPKQSTFTNPRVGNELTKLEQEVASGRRRWKVVKGTTSAIVAGSSMDWVRDERLQNLVLDSADE